MKSHPGDVVRMPVKRHDRVRIRRLDIVELDIVMAGSCQIALIGGDAETVDLGIGMLDGTGTNA